MSTSSRLYLSVAKNSILTYRHYPVEFFTGLVNRLLSYVGLIIFWTVVAQNSNLPISTRDIVGYYMLIVGVGEIVWGTGVFLASSMSKIIRYGDLSSRLLLPVDAIKYEAFSSWGLKVPYYTVALAGAIAGFVLVDISTSVETIFIFIATCIAALRINYSINILIAVIALHIIDSSGIKNVVAHLLRFFNGFLIPVSLMPLIMQTFVFVLPFAGTMYIPVAVLAGYPMPNYAIWSAIIWALVLPSFTKYLWRKNLYAYEAVGL